MALRHRIEASQGYFELGMVEDALRELDAGSAAERAHPETLHLRIQILLSCRRWDEALDQSRQLCDLVPDSTAGYIHQAYCLHELGRTRDARETLIGGPDSLREEPVFFYNLGCYEARLGQRDAARAWLLRSFEMEPDLRHQAKGDPDLRDLWGDLEAALNEDETP
ncbi:MAG: hypothetical protein KDM91_03620 [Verrucomicrobiae bacterium]|nr:hypothetical protein [Verrucomicrobiae bacterium]MCP5542244.1 hypothetical protein [Akkermansiaceae bacterium]